MLVEEQASLRRAGGIALRQCANVGIGIQTGSSSRRGGEQGSLLRGILVAARRLGRNPGTPERGHTRGSAGLRHDHWITFDKQLRAPSGPVIKCGQGVIERETLLLGGSNDER